MRTFLFPAIIIVFLFGGLIDAASQDYSEKLTSVKCGTFIDSDKKKEFIKKRFPKRLTLEDRPDLHKFYETENFSIHYDTAGNDAVDLIDDDGNGIPDYVDSAAYYFEYALAFYIDSVGYKPPYPDDGAGGSDLLDVYLVNIGDGEDAYYGMTYKSEEITPREGFPKYSAYIAVDNDFSPYDSTLSMGGDTMQTYYTHGYTALKITAAHELHHAIQFAYGLEETKTTCAINEMVSVAMEIRLFPQVNDYRQFVKSLYRAPHRFPFGEGIADNGYRWGIFGEYINNKFGDSLLLRMWEIFGDGETAYSALNMAFEEKGLDLPGAWLDFTPTLYYTGEKADKNPYLHDAAEFPEIACFREENFSPPAYIADGIMQSFELRLYRCVLPTQKERSLDTIDIILTNIDLNAAIRQFDSEKPFTLTLADNQGPGLERVAGVDYYYGLQAPKGAIRDKTFFTLSHVIDLAFPNPFDTELYRTLYFPVPDGAKLGEKVLLTVYSVDMNKRLEKRLKVSLRKSGVEGERNYRTVRMDAGELKDLSSGVYIYSARLGDNISFGKFVIKNK